MMAEEPEELLLTDEVADESRDEQLGSADDALVIELEGEEAQDETPLVKKLRGELRDSHRKLAEYTKPVTPADPGAKPDLWEDCEGDPDRYDAAMEDWRSKKAALDRHTAEQAERQNAQQREVQDLQVKYQASRASLPIKAEEFDAADAAVRAALPEQVLLGLAKYIDNPAKVVAALGRYPAKLSQIAEEPDMLKQIFMLRDLEKNVKTSTRTPPPPPERETILRGSAPMSGAASDKHLAQLEKDADRTGDRSKLIAYKASKRAA